MSKKAQTPVVAQMNATDALVLIKAFIGAQIDEAEIFFAAAELGSFEWNEEQAFLKALHVARAALESIRSQYADGAALIAYRARVENELKTAVQFLADLNSWTIKDEDFISQTTTRRAQSTVAAWGMVSRYASRQYYNTNAA